ncbi:Ig-like domain-containing protein [Leifsonia kafniensis]|uniref:Ig-like domain-containing protein n=1 Tax=Leifsonia kafniensis TaxID=475957 RepID=A0ABP7L9R4_9MICO
MARAPRDTEPRRRSTWFKLSAVVVLAALFATTAIVAAGFDVKQTPVNASSIWAVQSGSGNRYARINTDLRELDTIKTVRSPSGLVQSDTATLLFAQNNEKVVDVDPARPADLGDDASEYGNTPAGTIDVVTSDSEIGYLTSTGTVYVAPIAQGAAAVPVQVDPFADVETAEGEEPPRYRSDAIALATDGVLYSYSLETGTVLRYEIASQKVLGEDAVSAAPSDAGTQLTVVGDTWVLASKTGDTLWIAGTSSVKTTLTEGFLLQRPTASGDAVVVADDSGLFSFDLADGSATREAGTDGAQLGTPAVPTSFESVLSAAWIPATGTAGTLWSSASGETDLDFAGQTPSGDPEPVFQSNGQRMILNDTNSGWVWTIPDGALVASSQNWGIATEQQQQQDDNVDQVAEVVDPQAPIAEADSFGVRAGGLVTLPVLLNDHDANTDVLTIVPASVTALPAEFGTLSLTDQTQTISVQLAPGASGTATFSYAVTDGTRQDGLNSDPATVTLTVKDAETNTAPAWCGVDGCLQEWPSPEVVPGGTVSVAVLPGWVDPEGDPLFVSSVTNQTGVGSVSATPSGTLVYRHPDPSATESLTVAILVTVSDTFGATADKVMTIQVTPTPRLTVTPFAEVSAVGEQLTINPAPHLTGAAGAYRIVSATTPASTEGVTVGVNSGSATFNFTASTPGTYRVDFTVEDDVSEVVSFVRVEVLAADAAALATSPVTVFVRPRADTSVDVFAAVSNPARRVLLLSEALPEPAGGASLDVEVVGQSQLRVRGTTADEQPGKLGTVGYTVSDGTGNPAYTVRGTATVYLLPASVPQSPIAVADHIVVRAGAQTDIPVLANDVAPDGNVLVLNPESVQNASGAGLAFASGSTLRYLAPREAGQYELRYTISIAGSPELVDTATVTVEVLPDGENRAPLPHTLTARVLSGESIRIPFTAFGIDPDGDDVVLDRVLTQPTSGTAALAATGDAIVYSSVKGFKGSIEFTYRVRDSGGETGEALVRVGVLDRQSDPSPITFSDYVEVQVGEGNQVIVAPAANDIDPTGGTLTLKDVRPDAVLGSAEHESLLKRIGTISDSQVVLTAGDEPGMMSFVYEVSNAQGDIGLGLIVMRVVRTSVADHPVVTDTLVTLEDRATFADGLDVVTGKVSWASGDVSGLKLSLWGDTHGASVSGWKISGTVPDEGMLLAFSLTGPNFAGDEVTTYGFVRIPPQKAIILALKQSGASQKVKEGESVSFNMANLVSVPAGQTLEVGSSGVKASGQRADASCQVGTGTTITYNAGKGAPWTDSCTVAVRVAGQDDYTQLPVQITVEPLDAQPELRAASITLSPGAPALTYDLGQMVVWPGKNDPASLVYETAFSDDQFTVTQNGASLTIQAADTAQAGRENSVTVTLSSHPETVAAVLSLKVGQAPSELPKGATVSRECSQASGSSCLIDVLGGAGEVNMFPSTPLTLVSASAASTCSGVSFSAEGGQVKASWSTDTAGGTCQASFVVSDAQGRLSAGDRNGSVTIDLQGFPLAPSSVTQTAYDNGTLTLAVSPGSAARAYPALQGFTLFRDGTEVGSCDASGGCAPITGLTNGNKQTYEVRARNAVGDSLSSVGVLAWSYGIPGIGAVKAKTVFDPKRTTASQGAVDLSIENTDANTLQYQINGTTYDASSRGSGTTVVTLTLAVGSNPITILPLSGVPRPTGTGPVDKSAQTSVKVAGSPSMSVVDGVAPTKNSVTVTAPSVESNGGTSLPVKYAAYLDGAEPTCSVDATGGNLAMAGSTTSTTITGLTPNRDYFVKACYSNGFGFVDGTLGSGFTWDAPAAPTGYTFEISERGSRNFELQKPTSPTGPAKEFTALFTDGSGDTMDFPSDIWGADLHIEVKYCLKDQTDRCGPTSVVGAAAGSPVWQGKFDGVSLNSCVPESQLELSASGRGIDSAQTTVVSAEYLVKTLVPGTGPPLDENGNPLPPVDPGVDENGQPNPPIVYPPAEYTDEWVPGDATVPTGASKVRNVAWSFAFDPASGISDVYTGIAAKTASAFACG